MANVKISALPAATSVAAADTLPIVQSATTKKATFQNVIDAVVSNEPGTSFRNRIINGDFSVNQRGFTSTTTTGSYGFDRWYGQWSGGTVTYSSQAFTFGNPITGQEPSNFARLVTASQTGASTDYARLEQRIESVRTFAGQQITVSFWAKAGSGTPKLAIELQQYFGLGGSPSAPVNNYAGQVTLSTSWTRYSLTITLPSISGKTLGTNGKDMLGLYIYTSAASDYSSRTGTLGFQNATIDFWGVQVEAGSTASAFERRPQQVELAMCQRYFERQNATNVGRLFGYSNWNGAVYVGTIPIRTTQRMRGTIAVTASTQGTVYNTTTATSYSVGSWSYGNYGDQGCLAFTNVAVASANGNMIGCYDSVFDISAEL